MKVPGAFWWVVIPILVGAIMPVIAQFYPTNEYFWSALVVAIGGAVVAAIAAWRDTQSTGATFKPPVEGPSAAAMEASSLPDGDDYTYVTGQRPEPQKSFVSRWLMG